MDSGDSLGKSESQSEEEYRKQAARYPAPGIGLNHETIKSTAEEETPKAIRILQDAGYKLVSVANCLDLEPYEYVGGREDENSSWKC
jgi:ribosomal protein L32E